MATDGFKLSLALTVGTTFAAAGTLAVGQAARANEVDSDAEAMTYLVAGVLLIVAGIAMYLYMFMLAHKINEKRNRTGAVSGGFAAAPAPEPAPIAPAPGLVVY